MGFYLQDPGDPETTYLIEVLVEKCQGATGGGASFAWATSRGINLLLENEHFVHFLREREFDLVIGVDSVTDEKTLAALARLQTELTNLTVSVFLNSYAGPLFHPKVCWFRQGNKGTLVTGSGNLTEGGLSRNWEAFTVTTLDEDGLNELEQQWEVWKLAYQDDLFSPSHAQVIERAKLNATVAAKASAVPKVSAAKKTVGKRLASNPRVGAASTKAGKARGPRTPVVSLSLDVLVAEIPRGSNRWNQANFDLDNYQNYFGAKVGTQRFMFFRHVNPDGTLSNTETRPSVAVKSSNWRFELHAAAGIPYPTRGRPIAVFLKQESRNFLYRLVMPGDPAHTALDRLLSGHWKGPAGRIRRIRFDRSDVEAVWPDSPLWAVSDAEPDEH